jgi:hypothetical protein
LTSALSLLLPAFSVFPAATPAQPSAAPAPQAPASQTPPSPPPAPAAPLPNAPAPAAAPAAPTAATPAPNPYKRFLNTPAAVPLTPEQKARLAFRNLTNLYNAVTIVGTAGYTIGSNAHTAYGPAWRGFGKDIGYSYLQDATGEFFGTFLISSLAHEDPHYHRWPKRSIPRRILHAVDQTFVAQNDHGNMIPNYAALLTNPICAEISNLYVPGVAGDGPSTAKRIMFGYATEPEDNLITEFLPSIASHIHVRVIFVQRILNRVSADQPASQ